DVLADPSASKVAKQNALALSQRLGPADHQMLAGVDLRGQDLANRNLRNADLRRADLRGMRLVDTNLVGADLRGANLIGTRMVGGDLGGARISNSRWSRAALLGVSGLGDFIATPELAVAAIVGHDPAAVMIVPTDGVISAAFAPDGSLLAMSRGLSVEIVDVA